jgi:hypothetical protein
MPRSFILCVAASTLCLAACDSGAETAADGQEPVASLPAEDTTTDAEMSSTFEGAGDTTSSVGAGALTGAIDGGEAGDDGLPAASAGRGGPEDAAGMPTPQTSEAAGAR